MTEVLDKLERELNEAERSCSIERQKAARLMTEVRVFEALVEKEGAAQSAFCLEMGRLSKRLDASKRALSVESSRIQKIDQKIKDAAQMLEECSCEIQRLSVEVADVKLDYPRENSELSFKFEQAIRVRENELKALQRLHTHLHKHFHSMKTT